MAEPESRLGPASVTDVWSERDILARSQELGQAGAWAWLVREDRVWWSDQLYRVFGLTPQESPATYTALLEPIHPDDRGAVRQGLANLLAGADRYSLRHRVVRPDGCTRHVHARATVAERADDGSALRVVGLVTDITDEVLLQEERDAAMRALKQSEELYRLLTENAWDVIWTMELDGTISYVSPSVERVRGITPAEAMAQSLDQIHPPESAVRVSEYFTRLFEAVLAGAELPTFHGEEEYYRKDGSIMYGELDVMPQVDADGHPLRIVGVTRDVSERRRFEAELNRLAVTDPLTGVWNRRQGEALFGADLTEARRYGPALSALVLDIDHFKTINDTHGHQVGDRVLIELTERIAGSLRASDAVARWGGEEFVIVMRHCGLTEALAAAEKLRALVADAPFDDIGTVTVSIGAAELRPDDDLSSWLHRADIAMYDAKSAGRNAVRARE